MSIPYPIDFLQYIESNDTYQQYKVFEKFINTKQIILLLKGSPEKPHCKYSKLITQRLIREGIRYYGFNVWDCREVESDHFTFYEYLKLKCDTFPQLWVNGTFISNLSGLDDFDYQSNELGKSIHDILGSEWVSVSDSLKPSENFKVRVRDASDGKIKTFSTIEDAVQWANSKHMHLWYLQFPGYQDVTSDASNLPNDDIIPLCAQLKEGYTNHVNTIENSRNEWSKWVSIGVIVAAVGVSLLRVWRHPEF